MGPRFDQPRASSPTSKTTAMHLSWDPQALDARPASHQIAPHSIGIPSPVQPVARPDGSSSRKSPIVRSWYRYLSTRNGGFCWAPRGFDGGELQRYTQPVQRVLLPDQIRTGQQVGTVLRARPQVKLQDEGPMTTSEQALQRLALWWDALPVYRQNNSLPAQGTLAGALVVLDRLQHSYSLALEHHTAAGGVQIIGLGRPKTSQILVRFGKAPLFLKECGRTNMGIRSQLRLLLDALAPLELDALPPSDRNGDPHPDAALAR